MCRPVAQRPENDNNMAVAVMEHELAAAMAEASDFADATVPVLPGMIESDAAEHGGEQPPKRIRLSAFRLASEGPVWSPRVRVCAASAMQHREKWEREQSGGEESDGALR